MIVGLVGILIGLVVLIAGIYYLKKEGVDVGSEKVYGVTIAVGAVLSTVSVAILILNLI